MGNMNGPESVQDIMQRTIALISKKQKIAISCRDHLVEQGRELQDAARRNDFKKVDEIGSDISRTIDLWDDAREAKTLEEIEELEDV